MSNMLMVISSVGSSEVQVSASQVKRNPKNAVTAGYFGSYSAKMQDVGQKELKSMGLALSRKFRSSMI